MEVEPKSVALAIKSFPNGLAGGPDRLRLQHLKDLLQVSEDDDCTLLQALASFCAVVMEGRVPEAVCPFFFGASLVALEKKSGGVHPIAVGCTLRRLVAKVTSQIVVEEMAELLSPRQLGYGVRGGANTVKNEEFKYPLNWGSSFPECPSQYDSVEIIILSISPFL